MLTLFKNSGLKWLWITVLVILIDQWSKQAVVTAFNLFESKSLLSWLNLTYVHNYGAAFSFLSDESGWQRWFLAVVALGISIGLLVWLAKLKPNQKLLAVSFAFILGGAIGNLWDRVAYGYVIDFIDVFYGTSHFPAFNGADSAICLGAFIMILESFINNEANDESK